MFTNCSLLSATGVIRLIHPNLPASRGFTPIDQSTEARVASAPELGLSGAVQSRESTVMTVAAKRWAGFALKAAVTGALIWLVLRDVDPGMALERMAGLSLPLFFLAVAIFASHCLIGGWRWTIIMGLFGRSIPVPAAIRIFFEGLFFSNALPSTIGGDVVRIYRAAQFGLPTEDAINGVLLDRITGVTALFFFVLAGMPFLLGEVSDPAARIAFGLLVAAGVGGLALLYMAAGIPGGLHRWRIVAALVRLSGAARIVFLKPAIAARVMGLALAIHLVILLAVAVLAASVGLELGAFELLVLVPAVLLLTAVPISIGGWGLREGLMVTVLGLSGVPAEAALALSILLGLALIVTGLPGGVMWLLSRAGKLPV